jgi:hypothetical protein
VGAGEKRSVIEHGSAGARELGSIGEGETQPIEGVDRLLSSSKTDCQAIR